MGVDVKQDLLRALTPDPVNASDGRCSAAENEEGRGRSGEAGRTRASCLCCLRVLIPEVLWVASPTAGAR